jgi:hypothetical protein
MGERGKASNCQQQGRPLLGGGGGDEKRGDRERGACVTSPCKEEGARKVRMGDGGLRWGGREGDAGEAATQRTGPFSCSNNAARLLALF